MRFIIITWAVCLFFRLSFSYFLQCSGFDLSIFDLISRSRSNVARVNLRSVFNFRGTFLAQTLLVSCMYWQKRSVNNRSNKPNEFRILLHYSCAFNTIKQFFQSVHVAHNVCNSLQSAGSCVSLLFRRQCHIFALNHLNVQINDRVAGNYTKD